MRSRIRYRPGLFRRPPLLVPLFPVNVFTPSSPCPHSGPWRRSHLCCMKCHACYYDGRHPALEPPRSPPQKIRPKYTGVKPMATGAKLTRREKRRALFQHLPSGNDRV